MKSNRNTKKDNYQNLVFLFLWLLFALLNCSKPYGIHFTATVHDFGTVLEGEDVHYTYAFKNTGSNPLIITRVQPACVCTVAYDWDRTVAPGGWGQIPVMFKTPSFNGEVTKMIFVKTNIPGQPQLQLTLKGRVLIPIEIVPQNTWLGNVTAETKSLSGSFSIKNNRAFPLEIAVVVPPDQLTEYTLNVIEAEQHYRLDYTIRPPFTTARELEKNGGKGTVGRQFALEIDPEKEEYIYLKFFYYVE